MIVNLFIDKGLSLNQILKGLGISKRQYYYHPGHGVPGRKESSTTLHIDSGIYHSNDIILKQIQELLELPFVDYGYIKVTYWLRRRMGYLINGKKVYRLMKEGSLLYSPAKKSRPDKVWVKHTVPQPNEFFECIECDIKYIYIDAEQRNALLLTMIDIKSRYNMAWKLKWSIRKEDVVDLFYQILRTYKMPAKVYFRTDNGAQFIARVVKDFMNQKGILQEFIRPATPQQNGHIESYHSIVERTICSKIPFTSIENANRVFGNFNAFYNSDRIHSGIDYYSPLEYLRQSGIIVS